MRFASKETCLWLHMYTYLHVQMSMHKFKYVYMCVHMSMHWFMIYSGMSVCMYACMSVCVYVCSVLPSFRTTGMASLVFTELLEVLTVILPALGQHELMKFFWALLTLLVEQVLSKRATPPQTWLGIGICVFHLKNLVTSS